MMTSSQRSAGLSLIETIIVVAVIAIVLVAVGPDIGVWIRNVQIRNAAEALQNGLQTARTEAIRRNQPVQFTLVSNLTSGCAASSASASWVVSLDAPAGKCAVDPSPTVDPRIITAFTARDGAAGAAVSATRADFTTAADAVVFDGLGRTVGTTGIARIAVAHPTSASTHRQYRVELNSAGAVRMCDVQVSPSSDDPRRCSTA